MVTRFMRGQWLKSGTSLRMLFRGYAQVPDPCGFRHLECQGQGWQSSVDPRLDIFGAECSDSH